MLYAPTKFRAELQPYGEYVRDGRGRWRFVPRPLPTGAATRKLVGRLFQAAAPRIAQKASGCGQELKSPPGHGAAHPFWNMRAKPQRRPSSTTREAFTDWLCVTHLRVAAMAPTSGPIGRFRNSGVDIANHQPFAGILHAAPAAPLVPEFINQLADYCFVPSADSPIVRAILAQMQLVLVHPFTDGNGRLACFLLAELMSAEGLGIGDGMLLRQRQKASACSVSDTTRNLLRRGMIEEYIQFWINILQT